MAASSDMVEKVEFEVSLLSGAKAAMSCAPTSPLRSLSLEIAQKLGLADNDSSGPAMSFVRSTEPDILKDTVTAAELAGQTIVVTVLSEPEWCTNKAFTKNWIRGRRCGMEEDSEDTTFSLRSGGTFTYSAMHHSHDAECGYNYDRRETARGTWRLTTRVVKDKDELEEVICLQGQATTHTVEHHSSRTWYDDGGAASDDPDGDDDEEESVESPKPVEIPKSRNKDITETHEFNRTFSKVELLTADTGRFARGGWKVTELAGTAKDPGAGWLPGQ